MKTAISALHFAWDDIEHCLRRARDEFSVDGVELSWSDARTVAETIDTLRKLSREMGVFLYAHIWEDVAQLGAEAGTEVLLRWLALCEKTGVEGIVMHGGSFPDREAGLIRVRQALERVLAPFERASVTLLVENHYPFHYRNGNELFSEPWEFQRIFDLDSPALRFCFDTGHGHMGGNWESLVRELAPWLRHVHLADNHGVDDDHCMYRHGTVPWNAMFNTLHDVGFDGTFCVEFPVRENTAPFRECVRELWDRWSR